MVTVKTEITGLRELAKNSAKLRKGFEGNILRTGLRGGARPVVKDARANAPRDEGFLGSAKGISTRVKLTKAGIAFVNIGFTVRGFYGQFAELGTSRIAARPFLRPALNDNEKPILDGFIEAINKGIAKALGRARG